MNWGGGERRAKGCIVVVVVMMMMIRECDVQSIFCSTHFRIYISTSCAHLRTHIAQPDEDYPDWLWTLLEPEPSLSELKAKKARGEELSDRDQYRLKKLTNRNRIRQNNARDDF